MGIKKKSTFGQEIIGYVFGFFVSMMLYINPIFHFFIVINIFLKRKITKSIIIKTTFKAILGSYIVTIVFAYITLMYTVMGYFFLKR